MGVTAPEALPMEQEVEAETVILMFLTLCTTRLTCVSVFSF